MRMTVGFWDWLNGSYVKLTLRDGEVLEWHNYRSDDEGWTVEECTWVLEDDGVHMHVSWVGRDCDGRHSSSAEFVCAVDKLTATLGAVDNSGHAMPAWVNVSEERRDHYAEASGY